MASSARDAGANLTGVWHGLYSYPVGVAPVSFAATLIDAAGWLSGAIQEPGPTGEAAGRTLHATIEGRRSGTLVRFVKTYDGTAGWIHAVRYEGTLNADGTEIEGRWRISRTWSGPFLMIRAGGQEERVAREELAPA